jgi:hypothetical protein
MNVTDKAESGLAIKGRNLTRERLLELIWPDGTEYVDENALSVAGTAAPPGVGLGLYLAREIIVACGGYIKAGSEYGNGAVFSAFLSKV